MFPPLRPATRRHPWPLLRQLKTVFRRGKLGPRHHLLSVATRLRVMAAIARLLSTLETTALISRPATPNLRTTGNIYVPNKRSHQRLPSTSSTNPRLRATMRGLINALRNIAKNAILGASSALNRRSHHHPKPSLRPTLTTPLQTPLQRL